MIDDLPALAECATCGVVEWTWICSSCGRPVCEGYLVVTGDGVAYCEDCYDP